MFRRVVTVSYGTLALIPTGLSVGSAAAWANSDTPRSRALALWAWAGWCALPYSVLFFALTPTTLLLDPVNRRSLDWVQKCWAKATLRPFVSFKKPDKLPNARIVVSNHQSFLDVLILLACLDSSTSHFVSKREVFYIPLVGWVMGLIGHVPLDRGDKESGKRALETCEANLKAGKLWSVVFFAQGKRSIEVGQFKVGAFKLAVASECALLPVTINGSGRAMPAGKELEFLDTNMPISVTFHDPIVPQGRGVEELRAECWKVVSEGIQN